MFLVRTKPLNGGSRELASGDCGLALVSLYSIVSHKNQTLILSIFKHHKLKKVTSYGLR